MVFFTHLPSRYVTLMCLTTGNVTFGYLVRAVSVKLLFFPLYVRLILR